MAKAEPDRRRRRRLDARHDRHPHQHGVLRHRLGDAELLPRPPSGSEPARELADRRRPEHGQAALVAAARRQRPVELRRRAAAARLRRARRREDAADRLGRDEGGRLVRIRRPHRERAARAREGDRPGRAPAAAARSAGDDLPLRPRRRELLAGLVRPEDQLRLQCRRRDRCGADPGQADADPEEAEADPGRRLPRPAERELRRQSRKLARPRLDQRDQRRHRQAGLEVRDARAGAGRGDDHRQRARVRRRRRRRPARVRRQDGEGALAVPDRRADRGGTDALPERRQGVPRDHRRRDADLVERRHAGGAPGLRDRRQPAGVPAAFRSHARSVRRGSTSPGHLDPPDESDGARRCPRSGRGRAGRAPGDRQHDSCPRVAPVGRQHPDRPRPPRSSAAGP